MAKDPDFFEKVYEVVRLVPYGRVTTYGAIARYISAPRSARMVGYAMNNSVAIEGIAAHRVVNRLGMLSGKHHFSGTRVMEELLQSEGIEIKDDQVVNFDELLWDPNVELR